MMQALVQLRGEVNQSQAVRDTLSMLNLGRVNHATFVPETDAYRGMITKVNDWIAYGEPSPEVVETLLRRRAEPAEPAEPVREAVPTEASAEGSGQPSGDPPDAGGSAAGGSAAGGSPDIDEWVAENTDFDGVSALAEALVAEEVTLQDAGLSPTLRLHPPRGGHDGIKHPVQEGGELGRHTTEEIDALLEAMR